MAGIENITFQIGLGSIPVLVVSNGIETILVLIYLTQKYWFIKCFSSLWWPGSHTLYKQ